MRIGIRLKLAFFSLFLLAVPLLGYQFIMELDNYLRQGQEQTLIGTARAVATALHERPGLFNKQSSYLTDVKPGMDLYAHSIIDPIQLDGRLADWQEYRELNLDLFYNGKYLLDKNQQGDYQESDLSFSHMVGIYNDYLYAFFEVTDDSVVMRPSDSLRVDRNDHLYIAFTNSAGEYKRYIIANRESGWLNAFELTDNLASHRPARPETQIQGHWRVKQAGRNTRSRGYNIELRIPIAMLNDNIAFAIVDHDKNAESQHVLRIGTADPSNQENLGALLVPSPEIENIIKGLQHSGARVWVIDKHHYKLARSGNITAPATTNNANTNSTNTSNTTAMSSQILDYIEQQWLLPLYYHILINPPEQFVDELENAFTLSGPEIDNALTGTPDTRWRVSNDKKVVIWSAAHPIWINNRVMGAVVVEQTTNSIRSLRNKALEKLFHIILAVIVGSLVSFLFAWRLSSRIRNLRNITETNIDAQGKIIGNMPLSTEKDEIGDLARTFHNAFSKLGHHQQYLEKMASRLSHELRTPIAIVKSSLENLSLRSPNEQSNEYIQRAQDGLDRLSKIFNKMSEASRLEQALIDFDNEPFELTELLKVCLQNYELVYPNRQFVLSLSDDIASTGNHSQTVSLVQMEGSPELFVQMLDKIIANAIDFSPPGSNIYVDLSGKHNAPLLQIINQGEPLPDNMQNQLFDSMVSVRSHEANPSLSAEPITDPHLGIGLYIARIIAEHHGGKISIDNYPASNKNSSPPLPDNINGVVVRIAFY